MSTFPTDRAVYTHDDLVRVIQPRSIAVVGASPTAGSFGFNAVANLAAFPGRVFLVNPRYRDINGAVCYPDVASLPETPDCAVLAVNRELAEPVLLQCASKGVGGAVMFASGYSETGTTERIAAQNRLTHIARESGLRIIGPNCIGLMNYSQALAISFTSGLDLVRPEGPAIGLASQSGAMGNAVVQASRMGIPFSHLLTAGNSSDVDTADYVSYLADDPACGVIICMFEGLAAPARLLQAAEQASRNNKPLVVCKVATSEKGASSAMSHTGALAGSHEAYRAAFGRMGAIVVEDLEDLAETAAFLLKARRQSPKRGAAVLAASGGFCVVAVDKAERYKVELPPPADATVKQLRTLIPEFGLVANPCDMTAQNTPDTIRASYEAFLADERYDTLVTPYTYAWDKGVRRITDLDAVAASHGKVACLPWTTAWADGPGAKEAQRCSHIAVFRSMESCFRTLGAWYTREGWLAASLLEKASSIPRLSPATAADGAAGILNSCRTDALTEDAAKTILRSYGIPVVREVLARSVSEAVEAAQSFGWPVVAKIVSPDILHKTESGLVRLDVGSAADLEKVFTEFMEKAGRMAPQPRVEGILVQAMVSRGIELVVGVRIDPQFGPLVLAGMGGVLVELLRDTVLEMAPVDMARARAMLSRLKAYRLLTGFRGSKAANLEKIAEVICRISEFGSDHKERIAEVDINPLICIGDEVIAVDALIVKRMPHGNSGVQVYENGTLSIETSQGAA